MCGVDFLCCDARWNWKITKTMNREIKYNIDFHSVISLKIRSFIHFIHNIAEERSANHGFCLRWDEIGGVESWAWCLWKSKPPNYYDSSFIISFLLKNFNYVLFLMLRDVSSLWREWWWRWWLWLGYAVPQCLIRLGTLSFAICFLFPLVGRFSDCRSLKCFVFPAKLVLHIIIIVLP